MPMIHDCAAEACSPLTMGLYCVEHEAAYEAALAATQPSTTAEAFAREGTRPSSRRGRRSEPDRSAAPAWDQESPAGLRRTGA